MQDADSRQMVASNSLAHDHRSLAHLLLELPCWHLCQSHLLTRLLERPCLQRTLLFLWARRDYPLDRRTPGVLLFQLL